MNEVLERIYNSPDYRELVECLDDRRTAYLQLRNMVGDNLSEREMQYVLSHIQINESRIKDFFENAWKSLLGFFPKMYRYLLGLDNKKKSGFLKTAEKKMKEFEKFAREVEVTHDINVSKSDVKEFLRRSEERMPRPPQAVVIKIADDLDSSLVDSYDPNLNERQSYIDDGKYSAERFVTKWVLLFTFYNIMIVLTGGAGLLWTFAPAFISKLALVHVPVLYLAMVDLLVNLKDKELVK